MPNINACAHQNQPLSESLSVINRKSPLSSMKIENLCLNRQNYELSTQVIDNGCAGGRSLFIGCLNIFAPILVWFTIFYIFILHVFCDIEIQSK